ncbi:hypothetical protein PIB30_049753 [Stylosanthes scabra]|uniref:Uncharacterized protein n=1 Tax=Stylosanthes scabra TaxID=79078 RepID=A0ABU6WFX1_9FABA|nr:hypothetical protein [Stylosanthes scabra]
MSLSSPRSRLHLTSSYSRSVPWACSDGRNGDGRNGFNRRSSEQKWPERAKRTKGSQQNLESHCWTRCVRNSEAMRMHLEMGGTPKRQFLHRCVRTESLHAYASVVFSIYK